MYDWTEDRFECIQYMIQYSSYHWAELNKMPSTMLIDMVRYDLELDEEQEAAL